MHRVHGFRGPDIAHAHAQPPVKAYLCPDVIAHVPPTSTTPCLKRDEAKTPLKSFRCACVYEFWCESSVLRAPAAPCPPVCASWRLSSLLGARPSFFLEVFDQVHVQPSRKIAVSVVCLLPELCCFMKRNGTMFRLSTASPASCRSIVVCPSGGGAQPHEAPAVPPRPPAALLGNLVQEQQAGHGEAAPREGHQGDTQLRLRQRGWGCLFVCLSDRCVDDVVTKDSDICRLFFLKVVARLKLSSYST